MSDQRLIEMRGIVKRFNEGTPNELTVLPVYYSVQPPKQQADRRGLLSEIWGPGMQTADDAAVIAELTPQDNHHLVTKWRYSALTRTDLRHSLAFSQRDQLIITGVYGHMGCQVSAVDAFMNDIQPFLIRDAIADFSQAEHQECINWVARRCGRVIDTQTCLFALT